MYAKIAVITAYLKQKDSVMIKTNVFSAYARWLKSYKVKCFERNMEDVLHR